MKNDIRILKNTLNDFNENRKYKNEANKYYSSLEIQLTELLRMTLNDFKKSDKAFFIRNKESLIDSIINNNYSLIVSLKSKDLELKTFDVEQKKIVLYAYTFLDSIFLKEVEAFLKEQKILRDNDLKDFKTELFTELFNLVDECNNKSLVFEKISDMNFKKEVYSYAEGLEWLEFLDIYNATLRKLKENYKTELVQEKKNLIKKNAKKLTINYILHKLNKWG